MDIGQHELMLGQKGRAFHYAIVEMPQHEPQHVTFFFTLEES